MIHYWQSKLKEIPGPNACIAAINLFFLLLTIFLLSSNFVFLAGIKSQSISLPPLKAAAIKRAHKLIVTVSRKEMQVPANAPSSADAKASSPENGKGATVSLVTYEYAFNGNTVQNAEALRHRIGEAIRQAGHEANGNDRNNPEELMLVLMASKEIPYEKLIEFYAISRDFRVPLYLVTGNEGTRAVPRVMQQPSL